MIEFASVVGAVDCAIALQRLAAERNSAIPGDQRMEWRIGVHLGDVLVEGNDILGDGVNIAARLEALAEPGGICISGTVRDQIRGKVPYQLDDLGEQSVKNIARPIRVYTLSTDAVATLPPASGGPAISPWFEITDDLPQYDELS